MDAGRSRPARSQIEGPMMGEGRGVETVRVWVNVVTKVAIARPRRRRVALVVRRRVLGGCPRPMLLPTAAAAGAAAGPRRVRWVVRARPMSTAATDRRVPSAAPSKTLPSQTSSQRRGSPHVRARNISQGSAAPRRRCDDRATSGRRLPFTAPQKIRRAKLESGRVKRDRAAGSRASPAPGLRRSHVGPRRAAE